MDSIEEKRVFGDRQGALTAYVASAVGVVRVRVAGDSVGEFGLCERCTARDVAATRGSVAIATDEDVRAFGLEDGAEAEESDTAPVAGDETFVETAFGPAVAVGYDGGDLLAAGPDGRIARRTADGDEWTTLESDLDATVRAIDGDLIGTADGIYRVHDGGLDHAGLTDVRDISVAGVPLAATADGLYKLGNGWMEVLTGTVETVAADPRSGRGRLERAAAVSDETIYEYAAGGEWTAREDLPTRSDRIVAIGFGHGEAVYAVTERGTFLSADDGGWRARTLGVTDVSGIAIPAMVVRA
ncbi:HVO_0234 family beta-propeller protein [Natrinema halophilum]|uniref:HVO-0234-like beta-propeller domain-containing protein n=1 Tax=Natrinema halophilum TaxID=1699371 RepID=A0A7D5GP02_9EURY|nr:hypothetical protein [Natrinema halophilum]QLG49853.1 hypothetical protein HYG82_13795 [Natrinema halophilum]